MINRVLINQIGADEGVLMTVLSKQDIRHLQNQAPPLVEGWVDLDVQMQTNGFDLTLREVALLQSAGNLAVSNSRRVVSDLSPLVFDGLDSIELVPGAYIITYNEIVNLPKNIMALGRPRSSLLRCGVNVGTAVWDAGYSGRSQSLMIVYNSRGFRLQRNARIIQLVFFELTGETEGYSGIYQGENI
jgi:dUTP pyrophosphatase